LYIILEQKNLNINQIIGGANKLKIYSVSFLVIMWKRNRGSKSEVNCSMYTWRRIEHTTRCGIQPPRSWPVCTEWTAWSMASRVADAICFTMNVADNNEIIQRNGWGTGNYVIILTKIYAFLILWWVHDKIQVEVIKCGCNGQIKTSEPRPENKYLYQN
jgi:hypothetical protein